MFRKIIVLIIIVILISSIVLGEAQKNRYFLKTNNGLLKATFGVMHNFDNGFTTELTSGQLKALEMLGVEIELVPLYHISKPERCSPWSACKCSD